MYKPFKSEICDLVKFTCVQKISESYIEKIRFTCIQGSVIIYYALADLCVESRPQADTIGIDSNPYIGGEVINFDSSAHTGIQ